VTRKLILLDLALLALVVFLVFQMRREWVEAHARSQAFLSVNIHAAPAPKVAALPHHNPLAAIAYAEVALMNLFSKDRNPQVVIDVDPPKVKSVPAFPVARGVLIWEGTPPTILLSTKAGGQQRAYRAGDQVGEWTLVSVDSQYVVFAWDGQEFKKRIDELMDKSTLVAETAAPTPATTNNASAQKTGQSLSDSSKGTKVGVDVGAADMRGCTPGDDTPVGTVQDGYKKVVSTTPFGSACRWEQVK
jgi:hypothetical protein